MPAPPADAATATASAAVVATAAAATAAAATAASHWQGRPPGEPRVAAALRSTAILADGWGGGVVAEVGAVGGTGVGI